MLSKGVLKKGKTLTIVLCGLAILALASSVSAAGCKKIKGKFLLQSVSGPECISPVGICATGTYSGDIAGTNSFIGTSLIPTADTPSTSVVLLTGDNQFQTRNGTLLTKDAIVLRTTGTGDFAEVDTIISGTGEWAGATGNFQATGTFTGSGGEGEYSGEACFP